MPLADSAARNAKPKAKPYKLADGVPFGAAKRRVLVALQVPHPIRSPASM